MSWLKTLAPVRKSRRMVDMEDEEDQRGIPQLVEMKRKPYKQFNQIFTATHIHFYLSEEIGPPHDYVEMVHQIMSASESDIIFMHLNTPGGHLETGIQIINAMQNTQAQVITVLESTAYSMGTLIFLAGDQMIVNDNCMMMFHNFKGGFVGKGNELTSELEATVKWFATLAKNLYVPFLSEDELARIARGEDMWMQTPEIRERLTSMVKKLEAEKQKPQSEDVVTSQVIELRKKPAAKKTKVEVQQPAATLK